MTEENEILSILGFSSFFYFLPSFEIVKIIAIQGPSSIWSSDLVCISQLRLWDQTSLEALWGWGFSLTIPPYSQRTFLANPGRVDLYEVPIRLWRLLLTLLKNSNAKCNFNSLNQHSLITFFFLVLSVIYYALILTLIRCHLNLIWKTWI